MAKQTEIDKNSDIDEERVQRMAHVLCGIETITYSPLITQNFTKEKLQEIKIKLNRMTDEFTFKYYKTIFKADRISENAGIICLDLITKSVNYMPPIMMHIKFDIEQEDGNISYTRLAKNKIEAVDRNIIDHVARRLLDKYDFIISTRNSSNYLEAGGKFDKTTLNPIRKSILALDYLIDAMER